MLIKNLIKTILFSTVIVLSTTYSNKTTAQEGKTIFNTYCAACHKMDKDLTGPALMGVEERWGNDREKLVAWVKNSANLIAAGDKHATEIFNKWNKLPMTPFESILKDAEINAVLDYIKDWKPAVVTTNTPGEKQATKISNFILFLSILSGVLVILSISLFFKMCKLKKMSNETLND
ncbi:MAG: cytochrome c [Chitinophagaceae bacterium]|nr:cytochrome c [Chitinophagaceae bacterium]MCW5906184.1 cytochrome c [Chitinophagaceae bacterium]